MSDLPTLYFNRHALAVVRPSDWVQAFISPGTVADEVAYVPASTLDAANEALRLERAENDRLRREVAILSAKPKPCPAWNARGGDTYTCEAGPDGHFGPHRFAYETSEGT